ncbi:zinc finger protein 862-like [Ptychodera flava]|uniref:zinc finger protein 862-like n=1 Tax=Ptychodera flava TaxID=63121 RepID=UPI00396A6D17
MRAEVSSSTRDDHPGDTSARTGSTEVTTPKRRKEDGGGASMIVNKIKQARIGKSKDSKLVRWHEHLNGLIKNGVDINPTYDNTHKCAEIIGTIADKMKKELSDCVRDSNYISILIDGDTDRAMQECEIVYLRHVDKTSGKPKVNLIGQKELEHAHAAGVVSAAKSLCDKIDDNWRAKIVGFGADGASVNLGKNCSVFTMLRDEVSYIVSFHCTPHRLELVMLAVQKGISMVKNVHDVLNMVWKTYHYSPKSRRELASLASELGVDVYTPKSVSGTRWAPHVERALRIFLSSKQRDKNSPSTCGQYAAVLAHAEHLAATTRNSDIKGRASKVVREMTKVKFAAFCHFLLDLFGQIASLSRLLQANEVILPQAIHGVRSCIATVESMKTENVQNGALDQFLNQYMHEH